MQPDTQFRPYSRNCEPHCISGDQLKAALEILGLWFDGSILAVKLDNRDLDNSAGGTHITGHQSAWYAEATVAMPTQPGDPYQVCKVYVPVHPGPPAREI